MPRVQKYFYFINVLLHVSNDLSSIIIIRLMYFPIYQLSTIVNAHILKSTTVTLFLASIKNLCEELQTDRHTVYCLPFDSSNNLIFKCSLYKRLQYIYASTTNSFNRWYHIVDSHKVVGHVHRIIKLTELAKKYIYLKYSLFSSPFYGTNSL